MTNTIRTVVIVVLLGVIGVVVAMKGPCGSCGDKAGCAAVKSGQCGDGECSGASKAGQCASSECSGECKAGKCETKPGECAKHQTEEVVVVPEAEATEGEPAAVAADTVEAVVNENQVLPKMLELGSVNCIPCKMMMPIVEELEAEYAGQLDIEFHDVWAKPEIAQKYGVTGIPTQIFFDGQGKELFRHTGFYAKEDILDKCAELGIELKAESK